MLATAREKFLPPNSRAPAPCRMTLVRRWGEATASTEASIGAPLGPTGPPVRRGRANVAAGETLARSVGPVLPFAAHATGQRRIATTTGGIA
jgi:hypothetical protein